MKAVKKSAARLIDNAGGGELLEYALIVGLIIVAAIAVFGTVGTKVLGHWVAGNSSL
jgi:Flp pilus assembly pilin Flp